MTAGKSADRDNTCVYNCSYLPVDDPKSFDEAMFILLCGTGVGFSVESKYINQLPEVPEKLFESASTQSVHDSKEGWAKSLRLLLQSLGRRNSKVGRQQFRPPEHDSKLLVEELPGRNH